MDNKIVEKIQKLLALATSPNENEAKLAATKANELLLKHNLSLQDIEGVNLDYQKDILDEQGKLPVEAKFIHTILSEHFFVRLVQSRRQVLGTTVIYILGEETNVAVAKYVYAYLTRQFKALWKAYQKENALPANHKQSYYAGLMQGLRDQLTEKRKTVEEERGLVVVEDPALSEFVKNSFEKLRKSSVRNNIRDRQAMNDGREAGRSLNIARGVGSSSTDSGRYLG